MNQMTLEEWIVLWLENHKPFVKESTYGNYSALIHNYIIPQIGGKRLWELDEQCLQEFTLYLLMDGSKRHNGGLSEKTVHDVWNVLKESLRKAHRQKRIDSADFKVSFPTSRTKRNVTVLSDHDFDSLSAYLFQHSDPRNLGILIALYTGMRIGEICALKWENINLEERLIHVQSTLQRIYIKNPDHQNISYVTVTSPKSSASIRSIPITSSLTEILTCFYEQERKRLCADDYLLTGSQQYIEPRCYENYYKKILKHAGIADIRFHSLRHTFATRLIAQGADYKIVSELLGHQSVTTTLHLYVHPQISQKRQCVELLVNDERDLK